MAEAALQETKGNKNYQRLVVLLVKAGTRIVRGLFDSIHDPAILPQILQTHIPTLQTLRHEKKISHKEWKDLYPTSTTYGESKEFDLSLLMKLLRNICNLDSSANWDLWPNDVTDVTKEADLARVKWHRNEIFAHTSDMELSDINFNRYWQQIRDALLRIRNHYSPGDVDEWRKEIDKKRTEPLSDEDRSQLQNQYPEMTIKCDLKVPGFSGNADYLAVEEFQNKMQQLRDAFKNIFPDGSITVQNIYPGSIYIQLRVKTAESLEEFWRRYQSGELESLLENVLITDKIRKLGEYKMTITIPEEQYLDAQAFFDELAQHRANAEVTEVIEKLRNLSLEVVHGNPTVVSGNKFQAHLVEITNKEEIDQVLQHMKEDRRYKGATNIVWAYKYYDDDIDKFIYNSDDGDELLAGRRLQHLLEKKVVKNVLMIVTYWQGEVYLYLDICKNINERALDLLISRGLCREGVYQEEVPFILEKLEEEFETKKQKAALKAYKMKQVAEEQEATDFEIIHSEVITDRKSTFQAHLAAVTSENHVDKVLAQLKEESKIAKATYNMYAYRIYVKEKKSFLEYGKDDGENKAEKGLLQLLETSKVENAVVIVTRWHGGIPIGADRFKHINACASEVIKMAKEGGLIGDGEQEEPRAEPKQKTKGKSKGKHR